jgi:sulfite dehydrogenase (quinone) subunit SoeC
MNPAYSVILFTTASGAGYGLLFLLGLVAMRHGVASSQAFALVSSGVALGLITIGLLSSTFHLGHPERAWRALSQWRSSWLSREGVAAVATYPVALAFVAAWSGVIDAPGWIAPLGFLTAVLCALTVVCTAMIYACLKTIPRWNTRYTLPIYLAFALATGASLLLLVALVFGRFQIFQVIVVLIGLALVAVLKFFYWRHIDTAPAKFTMGDATGLGEKVKQWEVPHTNMNFVQKEMGFVVARRHALKLRRLVFICLAFAAVMAVLALVANPWFAALVAPFAILAAVFERWLFFAEAQHVVGLYYGAAAI